MSGGIRKTIILTVDAEIHSELRIIANAESKSVEELLEAWVKHLVNTRGSTRMINTQELNTEREKMGIEREKMKIPQEQIGNSNASSPPKPQTTRFIHNQQSAVNVGGGENKENAEGETIVFFCRFCFQKCRVPKQHAGQNVECPRCRNPQEVPNR